MDSLNDLATQPWMTTEQVSDYSGGIPVKTVRQHVASGRLHAYKVGKHLRFRRSDVDDWLSAHPASRSDERSAPRAG